MMSAKPDWASLSVTVVMAKSPTTILPITRPFWTHRFAKSSPSRVTHNCVCLGKNGGCWGKATQIPTQSAVRRKPQEVGRGKKKHIGSKFDDLLQFDRLVETVTATATKRVITHQIAMEMKRRRLPVELR
jgi:hypothetical protein